MKLLIATCLLATAQAVCYCPRRRIDEHRSDTDRITCNDVESKDECLAANLEVTDMVNSIGRNAEGFLNSASREEMIDPVQHSMLRTHLSYALEFEKPVGDCSAGLSTDTRVKGTKTHCFSPEILDECAFVRDTIDSYTTNIHSTLLNRILEHDRSEELGFLTNSTLIEFVKDFVELIEERGSITTANIICGSYDQTNAEINGASFIGLGEGAMLLCLANIMFI